MTKKIFLDIETLPPVEDERARITRAFERERAEGASLLTQPEIEKIIEKRFRDFALKAEKGRLLAIGIIMEDCGRVIHRGVLGRDRATRRFHLDEARTLTSFWRLIAGFNIYRDLMVGHNLVDFDLPFLCRRSMIHGVRPSVRLCFRRYQQQPLYDTMWEWGNWREKVKLQDLADAFGLVGSKSDDLDGSRVYDYYRDDRHEEIAEYCLRDTMCVREIYYRMNFLEPPTLETYEEQCVVVPRVGQGDQMAAPASL